MSSAWDWLAKPLMTIGGTFVATRANNRGAEIAGEAALQGANVTAAAITQGNQQAQQTLDQLRQQAAPSVGYMRNVMATPAEMTPEQLAELERLQRSTTNTMRSTGFAGSGRTGVGMLRKVEADYRNEALRQNRGRADQAAQTLYGTGTAATQGIANSQANTGTAVGKVQGDAISRAGLYDANAEISNGNLMGRAIGDIGSAIATEKRESRYADRLGKIEKSLNLS